MNPFSGFREIGFAQSIGVFLPVYDRYVGTRGDRYIDHASELDRLQAEVDGFRHPVFGSIRGRLVAFEQLRARLVAMVDMQRVALRIATFARTHGACPTALTDHAPADLVLPLGPLRLDTCTLRVGQGNLEVSVRGR